MITDINMDRLRPGQVSFVITKTGIVDDVELLSTSGFDAVDERMVELITKLPGDWKAATNSEGMPVDHKMVFFFGIQGC